ncbi:diguanylate cyclase domain-containing protein [Oleispirillum naphthae]|uniref:diguanylate cyclase domain-containing protein n=1 Tax=Oleispirillum naphthae TaxID=2838853 RepID=UPI003082216E
MTNIGSLCIVSQDRERARHIGAFFEHARYRVAIHADAESALAAVRTFPPDVVLIGENADAGFSAGVLQAVRSHAETADIPVALDMAAAPGWRGAAGARFDDVLPVNLDADAMVFRLQPLFRLSTMLAELRLRGDKAAPPRFDAAPAAFGTVRALYLSLNPPQTLPQNFLSGDVLWETAASTAEAESIITGPGFFDVAIIDAPGGMIEDIVAFCRDMRDNPRLFNLPFLVRMPEITPEDCRDLYRSGASRVLPEEGDDALLQREAEALIQLQTRRNAVRDALRRTLTEATGHPRQAVYTEAFLVPYLSARLAIAVERDRALSVVHLHLPEALSLREEAGEAACRILSEQLGRWLSRLVRVEDLAARLTDSDFVVVLPDTLPSEAQFVMNRIAGVLTFTDFAVPEVYRPVKIWPLVGVAGMEPGDTAEGILMRARANLS